jgi:hypothetical protein
MQTMRADEREKRGQESAAIGTVASRYQVGKFMDLKRQKHDAKHGRRKKSDKRNELVAPVACQHGDTASKTACEQTGRFDESVARTEKHVPVWTTVRRRSQHRERCKQRGKKNTVAQKIEVETKAGDMLPRGQLIL